MSTAENEFVISNVFKDVSSMKVGGFQFSPIEEHFGVPWKIGVKRTTDHLRLYLLCFQEKNGNEWSIEVWQEGKMRAKNGKTHLYSTEVIYQSTYKENAYGWDTTKWDDLMKNYVIDDTLPVELRVKIKRMTGINLRDFDESTKEFSDVVLVVENQKFFVSKLFLASQSPFFKSTLLKLSDSEGLPEHILKDVKAVDFQKFLELLYGESPLDYSTIVGITHLANMYEAKPAIRKCERFLIESSEKTLKQKLQLAHRYNLENLKNHCLSKITTVSDIRSVLAGDASEMDPSVVGELLQKSLYLHNKKCFSFCDIC